MVRVSGEIRDVLGAELEVSRVLLRAPRPRPAAFGLVTDHPDEVEVAGGHLEFECLPGPAVLGVSAVGHPDVSVRLIVPEGEEVPLEVCIRLALARGEAHAGHLDQLVEQIGADLVEVRAAARSAEGAASSASSSASASASSAKSARGYAVAAGKARDDAEEQASESAASARAAATSESNASDHASAAAQHEVAAKGHAGDAETSAESAQADAERAATVAGSTRWVGTQVEVNGKRSPDLMPKLEVSPQGTWVINGTDTGVQARGPGGASAWEDISGKPATFPPAEHTHNINDLEGIDDLSNDIMSMLEWFAQTVPDHAYVNEQVGTLRAEVGARPAFFSGPGKPPASVPGARVGDYWLDETSMELHKITGV